MLNGIGVGVPFTQTKGLGNIIRTLLFSSNEVGVMYDPSDFSTMFQDSAGTTPVTAVEQTVGLLLDKSKGLVLGAELVTNGTFDGGSSAGWSQNADNKFIFSNERLEVNAYVSGTPYAYTITQILAVGKTYKLTFDVVIAGTAYFANNINTQVPNFSTLGVGSFSYYVKPTETGALQVNSGGNFAIDNISVRELPGNHATQATTAAKPILRQDVSGHYYLDFDGVDDFLVTSAIDFTGTDKMSVFAGVTKASDAAIATVAEIAGASGDFGVFAPRKIGGVVNDYGMISGGTINVDINTETAYNAPSTNVLTALGDISGDSAILRVDGAQVVSSTLDQGTGAYANSVLSIGIRVGGTTPFNGRIYSLIIRGALSDAAQIASAESYVNSKTGAY